MRSKVADILIIMILVLILSLVFGSFGLYSWSVTLDGSIAYHIFYSPLKKLNEWDKSWGGSFIVEEGRLLWQEWKDSSSFSHQPQALLIVETPAPVPKEDIKVEEIISPDPVLLYKGETLDFLVLGDSLANSIGKQLGPLINSYSDMTCRVEGVISSNLIRLDYYDWLTEGPRMAREEPYDCILIFLGANTMQSFFLEGQRVSLFSDEWIKIYKERAGKLLDSLKQLDSNIYWMILPPMQKDTYDKNIRHLNEILDEICQEKNIKRLSYNAIVTNDEGNYVSEKVVLEKQILLRSDGIHFTRDGADYVSRFLIDQMRIIYELPEQEKPTDQDVIENPKLGIQP